MANLLMIPVLLFLPSLPFLPSVERQEPLHEYLQCEHPVDNEVSDTFALYKYFWISFQPGDNDARLKLLSKDGVGETWEKLKYVWTPEKYSFSYTMPFGMMEVAINVITVDQVTGKYTWKYSLLPESDLMPATYRHGTCVKHIPERTNSMYVPTTYCLGPFCWDW